MIEGACWLQGHPACCPLLTLPVTFIRPHPGEGHCFWQAHQAYLPLALTGKLAWSVSIWKHNAEPQYQPPHMGRVRPLTMPHGLGG